MTERKVYAIYGRLTLLNEPIWLTRFREKYDKPSDFHITLKQMAYIEETALNNIRATLDECLSELKLSKDSLLLEFNRLVVDESDTDSGTGFIYIFASTRNSLLDLLQLRLRTSLASYSDYYFKDSYHYEHDFHPHITIARDLDADALRRAVRETPEDVQITGKVESIVLSCLGESHIGEKPKADDLTIFDL